jgi:hypothetical protein
MALSGFSHQTITHLGRIEKTDVHIQGNSYLSPGVAGGGKGHVSQSKHNTAVGRSVKVGHLLGDGQRDPAVPRRYNRDGGAYKPGKGVILDMGIDGCLACFIRHGSLSSGRSAITDN